MKALICLSLLLAVASARKLQQAPAGAPTEAMTSSDPELRPLVPSEDLCTFLAAGSTEQRSLILSADPGDMTGVAETQWIEQNTDVDARGSSTYCPILTVGSIMGQPVIVGVTGINAVAAALCVEQLLNCGALYKEIIWLGTSGWSPQPGGLLNGDNCSQANQSPNINRIGDVCVSPMGLSWCFKGDWSGEAKGYPNVCSNPEVIIGPDADTLFGDCLFNNMTDADRALADEMIASARSNDILPTRSTALVAVETEYWSTMSNGTGVEYDYSPTDAPTIYDYTQCAEVASSNFWSGNPWDTQAREFVAELITRSGVANVTRYDVTAVSAMEANGLLDALYKYSAAEGRDFPVVIVRGNSNPDTNTVMQMGDGLWVPGPEVPPDLDSGYAFAIRSTSTTVLSLLHARCQASGVSNCLYNVD